MRECYPSRVVSILSRYVSPQNAFHCTAFATLRRASLWLHYTNAYLVPTTRIERVSIALQAIAMTSSAKSAKLVDLEGLESSTSPVQTGCYSI
jgi:hypothetical protein